MKKILKMTAAKFKSLPPDQQREILRVLSLEINYEKTCAECTQKQIENLQREIELEKFNLYQVKSKLEAATEKLISFSEII